MKEGKDPATVFGYLVDGVLAEVKCNGPVAPELPPSVGSDMPDVEAQGAESNGCAGPEGVAQDYHLGAGLRGNDRDQFLKSTTE